MVMGPMGGGGGLGTAQGRIIIDVSNVEQAATIVKQAAAQMTAAFTTLNQSARMAAQGVNQVVAAGRQMNQTAARAASAASATTTRAAQTARQGAQQVGVSVDKMLRDVDRYDRQMMQLERRRGVRRTDFQLERGGAVAVDTSAIKRAEEQVTQSMTNMRRSSEELGKSLQRLGGQFFVFSVAAGVLTLGGLRAANTMEAMEIRFRALEGSSEAAEKRIAGLTEEARRFNLPLTEVLAGIARLQPLLKQTGNETNRFVGLVARLATINPVQGAEGAAIAIGEALSGTGNDFYSLQERFNIPRNLIRQAIAETDNFADALDSVLNQLGATEQTAVEFGNTFQGAFRAGRDELMRLIGEGLRPILRAVTPIIKAFADVAARINDTSPAIATLISGTLVATAAMAPLLYAAGKLAELWGTVGANIKTALTSQRAMAAARVGGAGLAAFAGFEIGQAIYSAGTGESRQSISDRLNEFFAQSFSLIFAGLEAGVNLLISPFHVLGGVIEQTASALRYFVASATKGAADLQLQFEGNSERRAALEGVANAQATIQLREFLAQGSGNLLQDLAGRLVIGNAGIDPNKAQLAVGQALIGNFTELGATLDLTNEQIRNARHAFLGLVDDGIDPYIALGRTLDNLNLPQTFNNRSAPALPNFSERVMEFYNNITGGMGQFSPRTTTTEDGGGVSSFGFSSEQIQAFEAFKKEMAQLERDYNDQILDENRQYQTRRNQIILDFNEKVVEMQEDETRRRIEDEQNLAREIADVQEESQKDQLKARRDLESEIAKILRESRIRVLEAAAQLDARAVFEEQRRTKARIAELGTEFDGEQEERKRQAEERIKDLQDEFQREQDKRAQDFQRRMADLEKQKNRELWQLDQQHYNRLSQMQQQYYRERDLRNQQFAQEFNELAGHNGRMLTQHRLGQFQIEYELMAWYNRMQRQFAGTTPPPGSGGGGGGYSGTLPTPFQTGTSWVPGTDIYKLHKGEGVMTPEVNQIARRMLGGDYTQAQLSGLLTGGQRSSAQSYDFSGMQIVLGDVGGRSDAQVAAMIEDGLYQFFTRAARQTKAMVA